MSIPDPSHDSITSLQALASATNFSRPALRSLAGELPADGTILVAALNQAAAARDAKVFGHLYLAARYANRQLPADVLALGAPLLPDAAILMGTALRLEGNVAEALAVAIRSGRMGMEREASALITGWLYHEHHHTTASPGFLALTRKICRDVMRTRHYSIQFLLEHAILLSGDPVVADIFNADARHEPARKRALDFLRQSTTGNGWDESIPSGAHAGMVLGGGATVTRARPKAGRNDPCPCGSGKKFKQCCERKLNTDDQYAIDGVSIREATAHPELLLSAQRVDEMRSYELYVLQPERIPSPLASCVVSRLFMFNEFARGIELMRHFGREAFSDAAIDMFAYDLFKAREVDALRWLLDWAPGAVVPPYDMEIMLAPPEAHYKMLCEKADAAFASGTENSRRSAVLLCDVAYAAMQAHHALGLLVARGVLPVCSPFDQDMLLEMMEDTRDCLGLDGKEPGYAIVEAREQESEHRLRHEEDVEKARMESVGQIKQRELEIHRLKAKIDAMQESLRKSEEANRKNPAPQPSGAVAMPAGETTETRELRENLRRLKENLKVEHDEHNRAMRELRAAREQLRRTARDAPEGTSPQANPVPAAPHGESAPGDPGDIGQEWQRQPLRVTESSPAFRAALQQHPRHAGAAALLAGGRLAGGDPSIWNTVRALKLRPGILRVRVAGDYRLLFETTSDNTLRLLDFILRRDLDRWIASSR